MARIETILYVCDWCHDRQAPTYPGSHDDDYPPLGWNVLDHSLLCVDCQKARTDALDDVRHRRLNKDRPMVQSSEESKG